MHSTKDNTIVNELLCTTICNLLNNCSDIVVHTNKCIQKDVKSEFMKVLNIYVLGSSTLHLNVSILINNELETALLKKLTGLSADSLTNDIKTSAISEFGNWIVTSFGKEISNLNHKLGNFKIKIAEQLNLDDSFDSVSQVLNHKENTLGYVCIINRT